MNMVDVILKKKAGQALTEEEIRAFARGAADGSIPDYQLAGKSRFLQCPISF